MIRVVVTHPQQDVREFNHARGPLELGRGGAGPDGQARCRLPDRFVSKDHLRVTEIGPGRVRLENLSKTNPVRLAGAFLAVGASSETDLPIRLTLGETGVELLALRDDEEEPEASQSVAGTILRSIKRTIMIGKQSDSAPFMRLRDALTPEALLQWFEGVVAVQRAAAGSPEFFAQAARALVELVGLDRGVVLLRRDGKWAVASDYGQMPGADPALSQGILRAVAVRKKTTYRTFDDGAATGEISVDEVVAAPILDVADDVVGAMYGTRDVRRSPASPSLGPIEAQVVQLLAAVVGTGLARQQGEAEAARARVQFEQFFTPELATHLTQDPRLLEAQEREITVLFADMKGFSRLAESLSPQAIYGLAGEVMEAITQAVRDLEGVIVDYTGDGLLAMWNAPADQPDHAARACRAALAMQAALPEINEDWRERIGGASVGLGVGVNTGPALVGNTGTRYKFKYGPRGHTVNLGSRVEAATRQLAIPILITAATRKALPGFATRRICRVRVPGIVAPLDLFELCGETAPEGWLTLREHYERALGLFEESRFGEACQALYPLLADAHGQQDVPALTLLSRAVECLKNPPAQLDPCVQVGKG